MKVEHNDKWAIIRETPLTWGERNRVVDAMQRARSGKGFMDSLGYTLVTLYVTEWSESGDPRLRISWEKLTDPDFGDLVFAKCLEVWKGYGVTEEADPTEASSET